MFDWKFSCKDHAFKNGSKCGWLYALAILGLHHGNEDRLLKAMEKFH